MLKVGVVAQYGRRHHWRCHTRCGDTVDPHTEATQFRRQVAGQAHDRMLGRRIGMRSQAAHDTRGARHTDDRAAARFLHVPAGVLHAVKNAIEQDIQTEFPFLGRCGVHRADGPYDTGVIEHDVDPAERFDGAVDQGLDILFSGDIASSAYGMATQPRGAGRELLFLNVAQHNPGPVGHKFFSAGGANTAGATGDDRHTAAQSLLHEKSPSNCLRARAQRAVIA